MKQRCFSAAESNVWRSHDDLLSRRELHGLSRLLLLAVRNRGSCVSLPVEGWQKAYVEWMVNHGDQLRAIAHAVSDVSLQEFIHELLASAVEAGWKRAEEEVR
jgi:hypothetical protein